MHAPILALAILAVTAPALGRDRPVPAVTAVGKPVDCIRTWDIRESRVRSDQVIDFVSKGGKVYRNTLDTACPTLGFEQRFGYQTHGQQLCSTDIIHVLQSPGLSTGASCGLGSFQPVKLTDARR